MIELIFYLYFHIISNILARKRIRLMEEKNKTDLQERYPEQRQEELGLKSKMIPVPDDDSQTCVGSNRLKGQKVRLILGDLREEDFSKKLIEGAVKFFGDPNTLVLVAGKQQAEVDIRNLSTQQMVETYKTNVFSLIWLVKAALPYLHESSNIITANSIQADQPSSFLVDYAKTKSAIKNMTNSLAKQLAPEGIRVNSVVGPGLIWTPLQAVRGQPQKIIPSLVRILYSSAPDNSQNWQEPTFFLHQMKQPI